MKSRLVVASVVSAAIVLAAPFIGQLRAAIRAAFPGHFVLIVAGCIGLALACALAAAAVKIRERRAARLGMIALALALGTAFSIAVKSGVPEVDASERVHFIEYGIVTLLFYRVWQPRGDVSSFLLPVLAGLLVGTLDEWLQWFIPVRVGEARDVLLNLVAISCGLLFGAAVDPPMPFARRLPPVSAASALLATAGVLLVFASFVNAVHLGYAIDDAEIGSFDSHYTAEQLAAQSSERAARWRAAPPLRLIRLSREDQFMDEALWHVKRRNETWESDIARAWNENLILERYFSPVLDTPSYAAPRPSRWPAAQREDAQQRRAPIEFVSDAEPYPIVPVRKPIYWAGVLVIVCGLAWRAWRVSARVSP